MEIISQTAVTKWFQVGIVLHKQINLRRVSGSEHLQHGLWGKKALFSCVYVFKKKKVMKHNPCFSKLHSVLP